MSESFTRQDQGTAETTGADQSKGAPTSFQGGGADQPATLETLGLTIEDVSALQKQNQHGQEFIKTLKEETSELRGSLTELLELQKKSATVQDVLEQTAGQEESLKPEELAEQVAKLVEGRQEEKQGELVQEQNWQAVTKALTEVYGDKVDEHVAQVCSELNMSVGDAVVLARLNPKAALTLLGKKDVKPSGLPSHGSINTQAVHQESSPAFKRVTDMRSTAELVANFNHRLDKMNKDLGM